MIDSADFVKSPADGWKRLREIEFWNFEAGAEVQSLTFHLDQFTGVGQFHFFQD